MNPVLILALLLNLSKIPNNEIYEIIEDGKLSELSGDYVSAINHYKKAIILDENNYYAHLYLGNVYHIKNEYVKALTEQINLD